MKRIGIAVAILLAVGPAHAASVLNSDSQPRTIIVTEGGSQSEILIAPRQSVQICPNGCFVLMPNREREVLTGGETIEIRDGRAHFR